LRRPGPVPDPVGESHPIRTLVRGPGRERVQPLYAHLQVAIAAAAAALGVVAHQRPGAGRGGERRQPEPELLRGHFPLWNDARLALRIGGTGGGVSGGSGGLLWSVGVRGGVDGSVARSRRGRRGAVLHDFNVRDPSAAPVAGSPAIRAVDVRVPLPRMGRSARELSRPRCCCAVAAFFSRCRVIFDCCQYRRRDGLRLAANAPTKQLNYCRFSAAAAKSSLVTMRCLAFGVGPRLDVQPAQAVGAGGVV
ncbi:unnamed protein product, partial [Ectocarpus sp. 4 AP-2014]